jgi:hypothetical protein
MSRRKLGVYGRTKAVPTVTFRVSLAERQRLESEALAAGITVNELGRRRSLGEPIGDKHGNLMGPTEPIHWAAQLMEIYALIDPRTDSVRYVGRTSAGVRRRFYQHLSDPVGRPKAEWIAELKSLGLRPKVETLERCVRAGSIERETYWIAHFSGPGLLNVRTRPGASREDVAALKEAPRRELTLERDDG